MPKNSTDYYKILGVKKGCGVKEIKNAYRKMAMRWHPDKHTNSSETNKKKAEDTFKEINQAYEILSDPEKRTKYDNNEEISPLPNDGHFNKPIDIFDAFFEMSGMNGLNSFSHTHHINIGKKNDPFVNFMQDFHTNFMNPNHSNRKQKTLDSDSSDQDRDQDQDLDEDQDQDQDRDQDRDQDQDQDEDQDEDRDEDLDQDEDSDDVKKDDPVYVDVNLSLEDLYNGATKKMKIERKNNNGKRTKIEKEIITIDVKPGWKEGTKITFHNKGDIKPNLEQGDVIFIIRQKPHDRFARESDDLVSTIDLSNKEATKGFEKTIIGIDGTKHKISFKKGIPCSNYVSRIENAGMPIRKNGQTVGHGDLLVRFNVVFK
jgi:DnaJ family protein B protein 4